MRPITFIVAFLLCSPVLADCHRVRLVRGHHHVAPIVSKANVYYQVGSALREEAIAERAAEKAIEKLNQQHAQEMSDLKAQFAAALNGKVCIEFGANAPPAEGNAASVSANDAIQKMFTQSCVSCHGGSSPQAGLNLTDLTKVDPNKLRKAAIMAYRGTMPPKPNEPVSQENADALMEWSETLD